MIRSLFLALGALLLSFVMTGCGSPQPTKPENPTPAPVGEPGEPDEKPPEIPKDPNDN